MTEPSNSWAQVRELYAQARQQAADQRETWLQAQGASPDVLDEVRSLLAHAPPGSADATGDPFLTPPAAPWDETDGDRIGQRLGDWQITGRLGSGGMGDALAWLAPLEPANATLLRVQARAAYDQADALSPLKADHAAARAAVP